MTAKNKEHNMSNQKIKRDGILWFLGIVAFIVFAVSSATENYSNGERIGFITKFSNKGRFWKSWEGELNLTQTGMNTSSLFDFSIDNDTESSYIISMIDSAVNNGWKVKLRYHETSFKNWLSNRGETDYFIDNIEILDKTTLGNNRSEESNSVKGKVIDTIYVVIDKAELLKKIEKSSK